MEGTIAGRVAPFPRGEYSENTIYDKFDLVSFDGSSYLSKVTNNNFPLSDETKWFKSTSKGDPGEKGEPMVFQDLTPGQKDELKGDVLDYTIMTEAEKEDLASKIPISGSVEEGNTNAVSGERVFQSVNTLKNEIITEVETPIVLKNDSHIGDKWNVGNNFTGFGIAFGIYKNITKATIKIVQKTLIDNPNPATQVIFRVCENNKDGVVLYRELKNISIPSGTTSDVVFDFPLIRNDNGSNIWVEFTANSSIGFASSSGIIPFSYKAVEGQAFSDFTSGTIYSNLPDSNPFYLKLEGLLIEDKLKDSLVTDILNEENELPVKSKSVAKAINEIKINESNIFNKSEAISEVVGGNTDLKTFDYESSTFSGWGGLIPFANNFNALELIIKAWDSSSVVTKVKVRICKGAYDAEVIVNKTIDVVLDGTSPKNVTIKFDNEINIEDYEGNLWVEFCANGKISLPLGSSNISQKLRYQFNNVLLDFNALGGSVEVTSSPNSKIFYYQLGNTEIEYNLDSKIEDKLIDKVVPRVQENLIEEADLLLTSKVWLYPTSEYNIYNKNFCVPKFGDNLNDFRLNFNGSIGAQFNKGFRLTTTPSLNQNITLDLMRNRKVLKTISQNIVSSTVNNGSGITRKILFISDSTGDNTVRQLKSIFDSDLMNLEFIGTQGSVGAKHESRGGWTINDYATIGRKLYVVPVSGITTAPSIGAVYKQTAGNDFTVTEVNITGGSGYFSVQMATGSVDLATNGTLTKVSGNGDAVINYTGSTITSANPFYNPSTNGFDLEDYLIRTNQTIGNNDWIWFQLGINDVFGQTSIAGAIDKVNVMKAQMDSVITNIKVYNPNIKIGITITFPPADQDAFGYSYTNGQLSELYTKTGLITWQKKLIDVYDNDVARSNNIYLSSAHLNIDTENGYPTNGVYKFLVHGVTTMPTNGSAYSLNGETITITGGSVINGVGFLKSTTPNKLPKDGILTKVSGAGDTTINYYNLELQANTYAMQNNGVHPSVIGYRQIAEMHAGIIKYFG